MRTAWTVPLLGLALVITPAALAETGTFSCTADVGLGNPAVGVSIGLGVVNLGGCTLVTIASDSLVVSTDPADGCSLNFDEDGDGLGDGNPTVGQLLTSGTEVFATCDVGTLAAENSITLSDAAGL